MTQTIDPKIRQDIFEQATAVQKYLYSDYRSGGQLLNIANRCQIRFESTQYKNFALTVGDIILGFYKIEDTVALLRQELNLDPKTAAVLGAEVIEFLSPLSDPNWQPPLDDEGDNAEVDMTSPVANIPVKSPAFTPTNEVPVAAPSLRTLADNFAAAQATQPSDQSLRPSYETTPSLSSIPSYQSAPVATPSPTVPAPNRPKWSSEV